MVYMRELRDRKRRRRGKNDIVGERGPLMGLIQVALEESQRNQEEDNERFRQMSIADQPKHDRSRNVYR